MTSIAVRRLTPHRMLAVARSPLAMTVSRMATMALMLVSAPIIARALGPAGRGEYAASVAVVTLTPIVLGMGIPLGVRHLGTSCHSSSIIPTIYRLSFGLVPASVGFGVLAAYVLLPSIPTDSKPYLVVVVSTSVLVVATLSFQSVLIVSQRYGAVALVQCTPIVVSTTGVLLGWGAGWITLNWLISWVAAGNVSAFMVALWFTRTRPRGSRIRSMVLLKRSGSFYGGHIADMASLNLLQILALSVVGATQAGYFSVAMTVGGLVLAVGHALGAAAFRNVTSQAGDRPSEVVHRVLRCVVTASCIVSASLAVVVPVMLPTVFGSQFTPALAPTYLCLLASTALAVSYVGGQILVAYGKGRSYTVAQTVGLVASVTALYALGPTLGASAAALGLLLSMTLTSAVTLYCLKVRPIRLVPQPSDVKSTYTLLVKGQI